MACPSCGCKVAYQYDAGALTAYGAGLTAS